VFFIPVRSLMCAHAMPEAQVRDFVRSIPAESVAVFKPCVDSTREEFLVALSGSCREGATGSAVTIVAPKQQLAAVQRTPAAAQTNRKGGASKSGASSVSDGLTTVGTASSSSASLSAPGTAHSPATSTSSRKSPDSSAASTPVAPRAVKPAARAPASKAAASAAPAAAPKNVPSDRVLRVAGSSNVSAALTGIYSDVRRGAVKNTISADFKVHWDAMKRYNGWKCIYWDRATGTEVYVVPGRDKEPVANLIEVHLLRF
jgi:hypothetical protein